MNVTLKQLEGSIALKFKKLKILTPLETRILDTYENISLNEYSPDDLRFMILQEIGLAHLIPLALHVLHDNVLIETSYYEGDLLSSIIKVDKAYWIDHASEYFTLKELLKVNESLIESTLNKKYEADRNLLSNIDIFDQMLNT